MTWLRNIFKSEAAQDADQIAAYVDGALSARERTRFEARLAQDPALQEEVAAQQMVKAALQDLPKLKAPRNFVLDPAVYGQPERPSFWAQFYPQLRTATAVMSVVFMLTLSLSLFGGNSLSTSQQTAEVIPPAATQADTIAQVEEAMVEEAAEETIIEVEVPREVEAEVIKEAPTPEAEFLEETATAMDEEMADDALDTLMEADLAPAEEAGIVIMEDAMADDTSAADEAMSAVENTETAAGAAADTIEITPSPASTQPVSPRSTATSDAQRAVPIPPTPLPTATAPLPTEIAAAPEEPANPEVQFSPATEAEANTQNTSPLGLIALFATGIITLFLGIATWRGRQEQI